jgi:hypothetical protein
MKASLPSSFRALMPSFVTASTVTVSPLAPNWVLPLRFGQGQTEVGDIGEITGPFDLHDVSGLSLTFSVDFHQPQNPGHASTPG